MNREKETKSEIFIFWLPPWNTDCEQGHVWFQNWNPSWCEDVTVKFYFKEWKTSKSVPKVFCLRDRNFCYSPNQVQSFLSCLNSDQPVWSCFPHITASIIRHFAWRNLLSQAGCVVLQRVCSDALLLGPSSRLDLPIPAASAHPSREVEEVELWWLGGSGVYSSARVLWHHLPLIRPGMMEKLQLAEGARSGWAHTHTRCVEPP